jgi:CoA:oxalate CoA-transferase
MADLPLSGVRILAIEQLIAAPFGTQLLADLGAEVVDVEQTNFARYDGWAPWRLRTGRHKARIVVDLGDSKGQNLIRRLAGEADAFVQNYRPGVMDKYGLGYGRLSAANPRLIYVSISGFGNDNSMRSPLSAAAGYGSIGESYSGFTDMLIEMGATGTSGIALADICTSLFAMTGLLAALHARRMSGKGQHVDVALADALFAVAENPFVRMSMAGAGLSPSPLAGTRLSATMRALDGSFTVSVRLRRDWEALAGVLNRADWLAEPRFQDADQRARTFEGEIVPTLGAWAGSRLLEDVVERLRSVGLAAVPVMSPKEIRSDPHFMARRMIVAIEQPDGTLMEVPGNPIKISSVVEQMAADAPPIRIAQPGDQTYSILREWLRMTDDELHTLTRAGVIEQVRQ